MELSKTQLCNNYVTAANGSSIVFYNHLIFYKQELSCLCRKCNGPYLKVKERKIEILALLNCELALLLLQLEC